MSDIIDVFKERRSIRAYEDRPIEDALVEKIVQEAYYSPNAGNKQLLRMVVCKDREINDYLGKLRHAVTNRFWWPERFPEGTDYRKITDEDLATDDTVNSFYDAPVVVYLFSPKEFEFAEADAYIMSNNLCLIARNYDVGSVIDSVATDYFVTERSRQILSDWKLGDDYSIRAHASLGYPKGGFPDPAPHDKYEPPLFVG